MPELTLDQLERAAKNAFQEEFNRILTRMGPGWGCSSFETVLARGIGLGVQSYLEAHPEVMKNHLAKEKS